LHLARHVEVLLADDSRVENGGGRRQRVDRGIDPELDDRALEPNRRVEVTERRGRRGVGVVIRGDKMACRLVIEPFFVEVIRSWRSPISVASVGW